MNADVMKSLNHEGHEEHEGKTEEKTVGFENDAFRLPFEKTSWVQMNADECGCYEKREPRRTRRARRDTVQVIGAIL